MSIPGAPKHLGLAHGLIETALSNWVSRKATGATGALAG